ncbi:unnamed protein product, partial [Effrenium voratum]
MRALRAALALCVPGAESLLRELYTTNAACRSQYCVNPVFPAIQDMSGLEKQRWAKQSLADLASFMPFCNGTVNYNVALPMNETASNNASNKKAMQELALAQDQRAAQT